MGLLDDAIREHLELKRRSGADPGDVARLEREAFGAATATATAPGEEKPAAASGHAADDDPPAAAEHPAPAAVETAAPTDPSGDVVAGEPSYEHVVNPPADAAPGEPAYEHVVNPPANGDDHVAAAPDLRHVVAEPAPAHEHAAHEPASAGGEQETRPFTALEAEDAQRPGSPTAAPEDEVHDELEQTPDFLQETPDHDRLWFEQKPPRDFDF